MRIAVCGSSRREVEEIHGWVVQFCALYHLVPEISDFLLPERFEQASVPGAFQVLFIGFGGSTGFLAARALRERDCCCGIILIDDTPEYSIRGVRLHFSDFILRPVEFRHVVRSLKLVLEGGRP